MEKWVRKTHTQGENQSLTTRDQRLERIWVRGSGYLGWGGGQNEGETKVENEIGAKRKNARVLQDVDKNAMSKKRSKFEGEAVKMGQLLAKHM